MEMGQEKVAWAEMTSYLVYFQALGMSGRVGMLSLLDYCSVVVTMQYFNTKFGYK